jgi:hypothetical protein
MISLKKKFIFIHIPRTGGTSVEKALERYVDGEIKVQVGKGGIYVLSPTIKPKVAKILGHNTSNDAKHMTALDWKKVLGEEYNEYYKFTIIRHPLSKAASIHRFNRHKTQDNPDWVNFQSIYFEDEQGNTIVDDIFKYEELEKSWEIICKKLNIEFIPLPYENKLRETEEEDYREEVREFFQKEITKLGYE